jgi:hypothetical protein
MNKHKPGVSSDFYVGLTNGILFSIPLWFFIYWINKYSYKEEPCSVFCFVQCNEYTSYWDVLLTQGFTS